MTALPNVHIKWHGFNQDYGNHCVAVRNTVKTWVEELPKGTEFTTQEAADHIQQHAQMDAQSHQNPEQYETCLWAEMGDQGDSEAVWNALERNPNLEVISGGEYQDPATRYRRV